MSTDSQNPEQPQDDATPEAPEVTAEETISEPEVPAVVEPAEPEVPSVEAAEPSISSGLEIGSESIEEVDESEMVPQSDPVIRGKVDRYGVAWGTGRRKTAVARVRLKEGTGQFLINGRSLEEYFPVIRIKS